MKKVNWENKDEKKINARHSYGQLRKWKKKSIEKKKKSIEKMKKVDWENEEEEKTQTHTHFYGQLRKWKKLKRRKRIRIRRFLWSIEEMKKRKKNARIILWLIEKMKKVNWEQQYQQ